MKLEFDPIVSPVQLTAVIWPDTIGGYCSLNPETGTASQGETVEEALANLEEATSLYLEENPIEGLRQIAAPFVTTFTVDDRA